MATTIEWPKNRLEPGIYFGLPESAYHRDSALGSTDIRTIRKGAHIYWNRSWMNPKRPAFDSDTTPARIMGKAIHKQLLEGTQAFQAVFVRRPEDAPDASSSEKSAVTKACNAKLLEHQYLLKADDYDFVAECGALIEAHPELEKVLDGGAREVSVFWDKIVPIPTDEIPDNEVLMVRCKARFDLLKPRGIGDLKSIANEMDLPLKVACRRAFTNNRYGLQAEHYLDARRALPALIKADAVRFTATASNSDKSSAIMLLRDCAAEKRFAFQIIFVPKNGDPDCASWTLSPGNPLLQYERNAIDEALFTYVQHLQEFGTDRWPLIDKVEELTLDELSNFYGRE